MSTSSSMLTQTRQGYLTVCVVYLFLIISTAFGLELHDQEQRQQLRVRRSHSRILETQFVTIDAPSGSRSELIDPRDNAEVALASGFDSLTEEDEERDYASVRNNDVEMIEDIGMAMKKDTDIVEGVRPNKKKRDKKATKGTKKGKNSKNKNLKILATTEPSSAPTFFPTFTPTFSPTTTDASF